MSINGVQRGTQCRLLFVQIVFIFFLLSPMSTRTEHGSGIKHHNYNKIRGHKSHNQYPNHDSSTSPGYNSYQPYNTIFDVLSFGAKGDGVADDSKAFLAAWAAACIVETATVEIPSEFRFLIGPITLGGPCKPGLILQVDGMIVAPSEPSAWPNPGLLQWINFKKLHGFIIQGSGVIDGKGSAWWTMPNQPTRSNSSKNYPKVKPTAVRFYSSVNLTVRDIRIQNSPLCHLKFDNCVGVKVSNLTILAPGDSPNTDGVHLQGSQAVEVEHSSISCGDDCISIQTGCSDVSIHHIRCGPGHGISIGGLGKDGSLACVSNILVQNSSMQDTLYGVRIKTWQGGVGSVGSVMFSNIQVSNVKVPIMIDQFYCDKSVCHNKTNAVAVSNITYDQINGTYGTQAIHLACSDSLPCTNISVGNVLLAPSTTARGLKNALCWNSYGKSQAPVLPTSIDCLQISNPPYKKAISLNRTHFTC
ncbi:hypothetical protein HHK36_026288 [Tetracentron sinense]|uniref:endo-polygalacturonase n=1 Tax=Tetracentron sinense TaxID=13715 RepID=A0A834YGK7_TETSI|nr:hypothetical protein HHK36_026288 [Tetracentron sinense]